MNLDIARIIEQANRFWDTYGYAVILAVGAAALVLVVIGLVMVARSPQRDRWVSGLAAVVVLAWTSEGLWEVARHTLGLPVAFAVMSFFVFEAMMVASAMQAEQHRRRHGTPGRAGGYVWFLAACTAAIVTANAATVVEALLRFVLPLAAAGLWWVGITAERDSDTDQVRAARAEAAARRAATWAITPRTILVAVGIMRPGEQTVTDAERERRIHRMVVAADRLHTARPYGWRARRTAARLRRLARRASAEEVTEVQTRVARAAGIVSLIVPGSAVPSTDETVPGTGGTVPGERETTTSPDETAPSPDEAVSPAPVLSPPVQSTQAPDMANKHTDIVDLSPGQAPAGHPAPDGRPDPQADRHPRSQTGGHLDQADGYPGGQVNGRQALSGNRAGMPAGITRVPAPAGTRTGRQATPARSQAGTRPAADRQAAEHAWRQSLTTGAPMTGTELAEKFGVDPSTARRWIRDWRTSTPNTNGHQPPAVAEVNQH